MPRKRTTTRPPKERAKGKYPPRPWTPEDDEALEEFYCEDSIPLRVAAKRMGRSPKSIRNRISVLQLKGRRHCENRGFQIKVMEYQGMGWYDEAIAVKLGVSSDTVKRTRERLGLKRNQYKGEKCTTS